MSVLESEDVQVIGAAAPGTTIGPWRLIELLGGGGGGTVWRAETITAPHDSVAIKLAAPQARHALWVEWQALLAMPLAALPEPLWAVAGEGGLQVMVTRLQPGVALDRALAGASGHQVAAALVSALDALAVVHAHGLVHGDLHPGNLLACLSIAQDEVPVSLIDLGLACAEGTVPVGPGAVAFAAPQRLRGTPADLRDDLFSLAAAFWRAWFGVAPWPNYPATQPLPDARPLPPVPTSGRAAAVSEVLAAMLAVEPMHRPQSAQAASDAVARACQLSPPSPQLWAKRLRAVAQRNTSWSGQTPVAADADVTWWQGPRGSGKSSLLRRWFTDRLGQGAAVAWLQPDADGGATLYSGAKWACFVAHPDPETSVLGDAAARAAYAAATWLTMALPQGGGVVLVDDADRLPPVLLAALIDWGKSHLPNSGWTVRGCCTEAKDGLAGAIPLPPLSALEAADWLSCATGGRSWDGAVVQALTVSVGQCRADLGVLAADLFSSGVLFSAPTAVTWQGQVAGGIGPQAEAAIAAAAAANAMWSLPDRRLWQALAYCAVGGEVAAGGQLPDLGPAWPAALVPADADAATPLLRWRGGTLGCPNSAARHWLQTALPATLVAAAWRLLASQVRDPAQLAQAQVAAWLVDGQQMPDSKVVSAGAQALWDRSDLAAVVSLVQPWLAEQLASDAATCQAAARLAAALSAGGEHAAAARCLDALPPSASAVRIVVLARAELAFRGGHYAACRALCSKHLGKHPEDLQVLIWLGFAATWQGDREAAREALDRCQAASAAASPHEHDLLRYLNGLQAYYAGRLAEAHASFSETLAHADSGLRAALLGGLALVAHRRGELGQARHLYAESGALAEALGDRVRAINMAMNVAVADHEAGELGRALLGYGRTLQLAHASDNLGAVARAQTNRGNLLANLGLDADAQRDLRPALAFWLQAGNHHLEGNVCCVLSEIACRLGQLEVAAQLLVQADAALIQAGAVTERAEIQLEQAQVQALSGQTVMALNAIELVRRTATPQAMPELHGRALLLRSAIALDGHPWQTADADAVTRALDDSQLALELLPATKPAYRAEAAALRARALLASGHAAQARELAIDHLGVLARVCATLEPRERSAFEQAAALRAARLVLRTVADARPSQGGHADAARVALLNSVVAINRRMGAQRDLAPLLDSVMDAAVLLTGAERGFLLIDDGDPEDVHEVRAARLRVAVARNVDRENLKRPQHKLSHTVAEQVFSSGEAVLSTDAQADTRFAEQASVHTGSLRSILCVPLPAPEGILGVVYVDNRFAAGAFSPDHAVLLAALADQAAIAIQTARLIARQRQTAVALEQSRAVVEQLNAQLREQLEQVSHQLDDARADLQAQRLAIARRSDYSQIKGESPPIMRLFSLMDRVRDHAFPVLIHGESGTGKELVARAIHFTGQRKLGPFVAINCGALPPNLLESELFGHTKGAFTGAIAERRGLFAAADCGTLLLDEVGEMPLDMQVKLLRVLQTGEVTRVGESAPRLVNTRVVAATHRDLSAMVRAGTFREDLLYRLRVVELEIPSLRQRPTDIAELVEHFLQDNRAAGLGQVHHVSRAAMTRLCQAPWPGNVRQLEMLLKSACLFADTDTLEVADVEPLLQREKPAAAAATGPRAAAGVAYGDQELEAIVQHIVLERVTRFGGNKRQAAVSLGIDRGTLYAKLRGTGVGS